MEGKLLIDMTVKAVAAIAAERQIELTPKVQDALWVRLKATCKERYLAIIAEVQKDAKDADFFGQIDRDKKIPAFSMHAGRISLQHGIVMYAKELIDHVQPTTV